MSEATFFIIKFKILQVCLTFCAYSPLALKQCILPNHYPRYAPTLLPIEGCSEFLSLGCLDIILDDFSIHVFVVLQTALHKMYFCAMGIFLSERQSRPCRLMRDYCLPTQNNLNGGFFSQKIIAGDTLYLNVSICMSCKHLSTQHLLFF